MGDVVRSGEADLLLPVRVNRVACHRQVDAAILEERFAVDRPGFLPRVVLAIDTKLFRTVRCDVYV